MGPARRIALTLILLSATCAASAPATPDDDLLWAVWQRESGGRMNPPDGDGGRAIGPFQIHRAYWTDATRALGVTWPYERARQYEYARRATIAYMRHYGARYERLTGAVAGAETFARIHNGGPDGWRKQATRGYWRAVRQLMAAKEEDCG